MGVGGGDGVGFVGAGSGLDAGEGGLDGLAASVDDAGIPVQGGEAVGQLEGGVELERQLPRLDVGVELAVSLGGADQALEQVHPALLDGDDLVVDRPVKCVELGQQLREEAAARWSPGVVPVAGGAGVRAARHHVVVGFDLALLALLPVSWAAWGAPLVSCAAACHQRGAAPAPTSTPDVRASSSGRRVPTRRGSRSRSARGAVGPPS